MSARCGKRKLRGLYQSLIAPESDARNTKWRAFAMEDSPQVSGTNGKSKVIPLLGDVSRVMVNFANIRSTPGQVVRPASGRVMVAYLAFLAVAAISLFATLLTIGGELRHALPIAALAVIAWISEKGSVR